jgi:hypothetical protein
MAEAKDNKTQAQAAEKPPESTSLVIVPTKEGGTREMIRATGSGQFVKKNKPLPPVIEFTRKERKFLNRFSEDPVFKDLTEHEVAFIHVMRIAQGKGSGDPKADMAAVKAYEIAMRRALGKEAPSEQELDRLTNQPVKTIIVVAPELMHPDLVEEKIKAQNEQPAFATILEVKTNEKK